MQRFSAQASIRSVLVIFYLLPVTYYKKQLGKVYWRRDIWWFGAFLLSSVLISGPIYYAYLHAGIAIATLVYYAGLLVSYFIFGKLFSNESFTKVKLVALSGCLVGLYLMFAPELHGAKLLALCAALVSGLATGLDVCASQKIRYSANQSALFVWVAGLLVNIPLAILFNEHVPHTLTNVAWVYLLIFSVVSVFASVFIVAGSKLIEAGMVGIIGLSEVVFGVLFGVVLFAEKLALTTIVGMACIISAAALPYIIEYRSKS